MPIRRIDKTLTATTATIAGEDIAASSIPVKPHIQPGVLQPAVAGKDLSGTALGGSYTYGTAHTDGHSYYYTDIKGSKPIKDPRIGAHFGSQRHTFRSKQLLEQETATHGNDVYSVDGREWCRMVGSTWSEQNGNDGIRYYTDTVGNFIEITGYFSGANYLTFSSTTNDIALAIDGTTDTATYTGGTAAVDSPLKDRFVNMSVCVNLAFSSAPTLGIHTLKIFVVSGDYIRIEGIELIAQDTSSTANRSKIQIPAQNVVSYGKKFTVSGTPHYDPFNGFTNGTTLFSANVDTATSLGLGTGTTYGAPWAISSSNHIRPLNGGRVVKWVDSSGTIKTSVTMMPRNAQNIGNNTTNGSAGTASNEITTASATNTHTINFSDDVIDNSLSEIAKTFHYREFGNGSANGGTGASYADASMVSGTTDDLSFVMDDGLTSLYANDCNDTTANFDCLRWANADNDDVWYLTFIGTGISWEGTANMASNDRRNHIYAQNLPYGTHVVKVIRTGSAAGDIIIDGVTVDQPASGADDSKLGVGWITIYQPKMPPVPEDACILADYMLMADFVPATTVSPQHIHVAKGTRRVNASRDFFYDANNASFTFHHFHTSPQHSIMTTGSPGSGGGDFVRADLPVFCTNFECWAVQVGTRHTVQLNGSSATATQDNTSGWGSYEYLTNDTTLGINKITLLDKDTDWNMGDIDIATPIHTSSHYQTFETPYLKELVGGDRNMEQTNLVVTPDGKSWDEVTRNTSYLGKGCVLADYDGGAVGDSSLIIWDEWRGKGTNFGTNSGVRRGLTQKDFAIAYDRVICLVDGQYTIYLQDQNSNDTSAHMQVHVNGNLYLKAYSGNGHGMVNTGPFNVQLSRGDYIQVYGRFNSYANICTYEITRI